MAKTGNWPVPKFHFEVDFGNGGRLGFQACSGLASSLSIMEFRDGNATSFYKQRRPTMVTYEPVTLRKGVFQGDMNLYKWYKNIAEDFLFGDMRTVTISLMDAVSGVKPVTIMQWRLEGAFISKFTPPELDAEADEVAVEEIELTYQAFSVSEGASSVMSGLTKFAGAIGGAPAAALIGGVSRIASSVSIPSLPVALPKPASLATSLIAKATTSITTAVKSQKTSFFSRVSSGIKKLFR